MRDENTHKIIDHGEEGNEGNEFGADTGPGVEGRTLVLAMMGYKIHILR
jgi:hypothetical protein